MQLVPIRFADARRFVHEHHRHNKEPRGWLFGVGLLDSGDLVGVAVASRPIARMLDDGLTMEVTRTCTLGARNANSMLYGALWRAGQALDYRRGITYTLASESGSSLKAVGWSQVEFLPARKDWARSSVLLRDMRDPPQGSLFIDSRRATGGVDRWRWQVTSNGPAGEGRAARSA
jgi:hypothetical protein